VQQTRRARVPLVEACRSWREALETCEDGLKIMLWEKQGEKLKNVLKEYFACHSSLPSCEKGVVIYAMVGPEGGFTEEEVKQARERGFIPVKLGQRILRTETASITLVGILQYELGDIG
jgi:16S rRNA (uracil1498-N3)-methyltransferase